MDSVPSGSDPENSGEAQGRRQSAGRFGDAQRHLRSLTEKFTIRNRIARVAKLADAPDLGFRNHRFQMFLFVSKNNRFTRGKRDFSRSTSRFPMTSGNVVILAQFLVQISPQE